MNLLLDTNIFLEIILDQEKAADARELIGTSGEHTLYISDYSLHSIGLLLFKRKLHNIFDRFISDIIVTGNVLVIRLAAEELTAATTASQKFRLDFDDAYQYAVAEKRDLTIISFDADFDRTERRKKTPAELL